MDKKTIKTMAMRMPALNDKVRCLPEIHAGMSEALQPIRQTIVSKEIQLQTMDKAAQKRLRKQERNKRK